MSVNEAAWILEAKGDLRVQPAPYPVPEQNEIVIKNQAFAIQPFDANVRGKAYIDVPYPFILGNGVAGIIKEIGPSVTKFKKGDRVVSDTPIYQLKETKYGCWQTYVVGIEATTAKIPENTTFEDAVAIPFALLTAVAALHLGLGMSKPKSNCSGKALIWGASGSVGGYAVQYASSVGYDVVATASPRKFDYVRGLGASEVLDYKDDQIVEKLRELGPYDFVMIASGDAVGATAISDILQPAGGKFASTRPKSDEMHLAANVSLIYDFFSMTTQKAENAAFTTWWYGDYLPTALAGGVTPTPLEKRPDGSLLQSPCRPDYLFDDGPNGPIAKEIPEMIPNAPLIRRPGQINAMDNEDFANAVKATGKKQVIISGVLTEVCVAFPALSLIERGYDVFVVTDASGTFKEHTREAAHKRMVQAGCQLLNWAAIAAELHRDWRRDIEGFGAIWNDYVPGYRCLTQSYMASKDASK